MVASVQAGDAGGGFAWATQLTAQARARAAQGLPVMALPAPSTPQGPAPEASVGVGRHRALSDGVTLDRPFEMLPTFFTNVLERVTGERDERGGKAVTQLLLAGQQLLQAGLRSVASGTGAVAAGSSVLGKVLPVVGVASGVVQIRKGWTELGERANDPTDLIHSRTARTGVLQVLAGALLFVPGVGTALSGAATRLVAAANELDAFRSLDWPTTRVEEQGAAVAARVHPLDETPTDPHDRTARQGAALPVLGVR